MTSPSADFPVDPSKPGKHPVVLSDALIGSTRTDIFTGVRFNHKPKLSSDAGPDQAQLTPSSAADDKTAGYDLSFTDNGGKYAYAGARVTDETQYVLYWDPKRAAWVLDKLDSVFHMNLTQTPDESNPDVLQRQFPHLDLAAAPAAAAKVDAAAAAKSQKLAVAKIAAAAKTNGATTAAAKGKKEAPPRKKTKPQPRETIELSLPEQALPQPVRPEPEPGAAPMQLPKIAAAKATRRRGDNKDSGDSDDDDDGGLLVEYPGSEPNTRDSRPGHFSPAVPPAHVPIRRFSDLLRESDDAEAESDTDEPDPLASFHLPSPAQDSFPSVGRPTHPGLDENEAAGLAFDLEAELEAEFMQKEREAGAESDVSEED